MPKTSLKTLSFALGVGRMGTWELDLEHHSLTCSAAFKRNFGIPPDQDFTYQQLIHAIHQQDRPRWHSAVDSAIQDSPEFELEYRIFWPDGTLHWNLIHGGPVQLENTQRNLLVGVSLDLTQRKRDEMELRLSEERHRALTTATAQIIWVTDANGFGREDQSSWETVLAWTGCIPFTLMIARPLLADGKNLLRPGKYTRSSIEFAGTTAFTV
jgi:PAS domain-containing protein